MGNQKKSGGIKKNRSVSKKIPRGDPAKKKNFCVLCIKLANFFMSPPPTTLNSHTASRLDYYLSRLFEGLSKTANKGKFFDQHLLNEESKDNFIDEIANIALFATQIPLSIFTNLFHQRFEKHSMLKSTLEILQQFYIQVETQSDEFHLFDGDLSTYRLRCIRCGQPVTLAGSIGEILYHAPDAMLYHWNMIEPHCSKFTENQF